MQNQKYIKSAGDIFSKFNGKYLKVDNNPIILEGEWDYSNEYQTILKHRLLGAKCDTIMVE